MPFLLFFFCSACEKAPGIDDSLGPIKKNYVGIYIDVDSISFSYKEFNENNSNVSMGAGFHGKEYRQWIRDEKDVHQKYAALYGDTSFYQPAACCFSGGCPLDTVRLSVLCDKSYNDTHTAGGNINHLLEIHYYSAKEAVANNYFKDKYVYLCGQIPYNLRLDSLNMRKNHLFGSSFALDFLEAPDNSGKYTFTLVYEGNSGKRIEKQSEPIYLEGKD